MLEHTIKYCAITPGAKTASQKPKILRDGRPIAVNSIKYSRQRIAENLKFNIHLNFVERKIAGAEWV